MIDKLLAVICLILMFVVGWEAHNVYSLVHELFHPPTLNYLCENGTVYEQADIDSGVYIKQEDTQCVKK